MEKIKDKIQEKEREKIYVVTTGMKKKKKDE